MLKGLTCSVCVCGTETHSHRVIKSVCFCWFNLRSFVKWLRWWGGTSPSGSSCRASARCAATAGCSTCARCVNLIGSGGRRLNLIGRCSCSVLGAHQTCVCVRQVCAANFGDMCGVVGGEATEELLVGSAPGDAGQALTQLN